MKIIIPKQKVLVFVCAFSGVLSMNPYFVWPTFLDGILTYLVYLFYAMGIVGMIIKGSTKQRFGKKELLSVLLLVGLYVYIYLFCYTSAGLRWVLGGALLYVFLICFCTRNIDFKSDVFEMFVTLFVISMIPGLVYYLLEMIGVSLSIGTLYSQNQLIYANSLEALASGSRGYYKLYIGAVLRVNANTRFSGIYDEAGLVGTVAAIALVARGFKLKGNWKNVFLLLFCIISFSLAGYILLCGYFFLKWIQKGQWKLCIGTVAGIIFLSIILNMNTSNELINNIQSRISLTQAGIEIMNNRETSSFNIAYKEITEGSLEEKLFGFGHGASTSNPYMNGSSSYKCKIYDYGYFGFGMMLITILFLFDRFHLNGLDRQWPQLILLILFMVSIYQRPSVYYPYYFILLYGGSSYLSKKNIGGIANASN